jgi:hypothetical protein
VKKLVLLGLTGLCLTLAGSAVVLLALLGVLRPAIGLMVYLPLLAVYLWVRWLQWRGARWRCQACGDTFS